VKSWEARIPEKPAKDQAISSFAIDWFENRLNEVRAELDTQFSEFRLSEALKTTYSLIWDDFCSWYLEWVKPGYEQPVERAVYERTVGFFEQLMQLLHPFMPFITEEIFHQLRPQEVDLTVKLYPAPGQQDAALSVQGNYLKEVISAIRDARNKNQLKPKDPIKLHVQTENNYADIEPVLLKQVNASSLSYNTAAVANTITVVVQKDKYFIETSVVLDNSAQKEQLEKDLEYLKGFLISVEKKLGNERFVQNAKPEVIDSERKKKADAEAKIRVIQESLASLM
jgi:valyl-tRNA synthetase